MRIRNVFAAALFMALPLTGAFAQGGEVPHISSAEAKRWADENRAKKPAPADAHSKSLTRIGPAMRGR
jgi:hypothetical protein